MCKKGEVAEALFDGVLSKFLDGIVKKIVDALTAQLEKACPQTPPTIVDGTPEDPVELALPDCCKSMFRSGGRAFKRGVMDVENKTV